MSLRDPVAIPVSRCMSTQHPDNARAPFFSSGPTMSGDDEVKEAYYVFSHLKIKEQLWDFEGKESDGYVIRKLLLRYPDYFRKTRIGEDVHITYRVPNPEIERADAKIMLETLESIPRSHDAMAQFMRASSGQDAPDEVRDPDRREQPIAAPIREVFLPMCRSAPQLLRISEYYRKFVVGKAASLVHDISVRDWIGDFSPTDIRVTGLFEDRESILNAHKIVGEFLSKERVSDYQRVWFARSDPALNYGSLATILIVKLGLMRLHELQERSSVSILPIIGCGSAPFRGNMKPSNVATILRGYPSVHTYTLQSAFKYDNDERAVMDAVETINSTPRKAPPFEDPGVMLPIIDKLTARYQEEVALLAPLVNDFAQFVPSRRKRKLHVGLFGYARAKHGGVHLPRAISFCASLYSLGIPPELLGLSALTASDIEAISSVYGNFESDMKDSLRLLNKQNLRLVPDAVRERILQAATLVYSEPDEEHAAITSRIPAMYKSKNSAELEESIVAAGRLRGFLG